MIQDHEEIFEELQAEDVKERQKKQSKEKEIPGMDKLKPTFPPKKAKPVVKIAKAGGYVKAADGCAQRGKTRGRIV